MLRRDLIGGIVIAGTALASPARSQAPSSTARIAQRFASTLTAHEIDAFAALFADDYVNHQVSAAAPPSPSGVSFKQRTVAFFADRLKGLPDLTVTIEAIVADGDKVAASFVYEGAHQGVYLGVPPTGKRLRFTSCDIFRVKDDRIAEHWGMGDAAGILVQLRG